jgi:SAM-dependent methyltransferase
MALREIWKLSQQEKAVTQTAMFDRLRRTISAVPIIGGGAKAIYYMLAPTAQRELFRSSPEYWEMRYAQGGNSGAGSYGRLSRHKAEVINGFVDQHDVASVIEFGCGDGAQLQLANYRKYTGVDVSWRALELCRTKFRTDKTKRFVHMSAARNVPEHAELALSLDVIYHLVEEDIFADYMSRLFGSAERYVCIYSSNLDAPGPAPHVRHRCFTDWIRRCAPKWTLISHIPNRYPYDPIESMETSWSDFYFYARRD